MTATLTIRMDQALKHEAEEFFSDIGMNLTTAITCFFKKTLDMNALPFTLGRTNPRRELELAIAESRQMMANPANYKHYDNMADFIKDVEA